VPAELPLFIIEKRERKISMINNLIEYIKIHLISLNQDLENALQGEGYDYLKGQIKATEHLLSVAEDILNNDHQGEGY
jgi:hypothetical protein